MENQAPDIIPELAELRKPQKAFSVPPPPELTGLSTQIGGGVPGVPTDYAAERAKYKKPEEASAQQAKLLQRQQQLETDIGTASQAKEQYLSEAKADIARQQRESAQTVEANLEATRAAFPYKEFHPTKDNIETLSTLFGLIGVVGMAMGGSGKMSAMNSLNAMSGMMKGWQQGRADVWKREKEEFDKNMQRTKAILEDAYRDADRAMKTLAYNVQEAEALAAQSAAKLGGQVGKQILEKQGVEKFYTFLEGVKKDLTHAEDKAQEKARYEAELARKKSEDIERRAHQKRMEDFREREIAAKERKSIAAAGGPSALVKEYTGIDMNDKQALPITQVSKAMGEAFSLADLASQSPKLVGRSGQMKSFVERYVDSLTGAGKAIPDKDSGLSQDALVFAKRYASYLVSYERSLAGGARGFTVSFQNRFNKLMEQNQFTPEGFVALMRDHARELATSATSTAPGITFDQLAQMGIDIQNRSGDPYAEDGYSLIKKERGAGGRKEEPSGLAVGTVKQGYRYKGGDPSQESNWEKVKE